MLDILVCHRDSSHRRYISPHPHGTFTSLSVAAILSLPKHPSPHTTTTLPNMDSHEYISTMPTMDIFAHESVPGTEKSLLRRQQTTPERRFSISFEEFDSDFDMDLHEDLDMEDDYFSQTYAPLSCLPTPPMSCATASPFTQALESAFGEDEDNDLLGMCSWCLNGISILLYHLTNTIQVPQSTSQT